MKAYRYFAIPALLFVAFGPASAKQTQRVVADTNASAPAKAPVVDPKAKELLTQMASAYRTLRSCSLRVEIREGSGTQPGVSVAGSVSFKRPNEAAVIMKSDRGTSTAIADGKYIYVSESQDKKEYAKGPAPPDSKSIFQTIQAGGGDVIGLLPFMVAGNDSYLVISRNLKSLTLLAPDVVSGVSVDVVQAIETAPGHGDATMTLAIGRSDHLLRRVGFLASDGGVMIIETLSNVKVNPPLADSVFHFVPPPGAKPVPLT